MGTVINGPVNMMETISERFQRPFTAARRSKRSPRGYLMHSGMPHRKDMGLDLPFHSPILHVPFEPICPLPCGWDCPVLQLQMTLDHCPDTSAFCWPGFIWTARLLFCPRFCPADPPHARLPGMYVTAVINTCRPLWSIAAAVWLLVLVNLVFWRILKFFRLVENGWYVWFTLWDDTNSSPDIPCLNTLYQNLFTLQQNSLVLIIFCLLVSADCIVMQNTGVLLAVELEMLRWLNHNAVDTDKERS